MTKGLSSGIDEDEVGELEAVGLLSQASMGGRPGSAAATAGFTAAQKSLLQVGVGVIS